ncbi:Uncharacterized protein BP5553_05202 [Venustampulla echinocandica]|uniref:Pre-rRNA processing protein n=1 Tax=Venustampulla echinocandica TaxID=2656787 RepID=A0A370TQH2_9HELO|nr:Uncharacterized protein BP5553_05202 [Venustampulla echinocandica]RDL37769.1 Uncharacterized protein BP5553_05202 [Venustampulla echinocandica]
MSDNPSSPLLGSPARSRSSSLSKDSRHSDDLHEDTPLLSRSDDTPRYDGSQDGAEEGVPSAAAISLRSLQNGHGSSSSLASKGVRRWPAVVFAALLATIIIAITLGAFFAPGAVEEYAKEALVIEPTNLSIDSITSTGVNARIQASFRMDASRVANEHIRNIGRFGTWIAHKVETQEAKVEVYLPEYGNLLIGTATVPRVVVNIRNGETTLIDFIAALEPGNIEGIRQVANDWLEGRLGTLRVLGKTNVGLKTGLIPLGTQTISESLMLEGDHLTIPEYNITRLNFHEIPLSSSGRRGMAADVSLSVINSYPVKFTIPPLGFDILVPNCVTDDPYIRLAEATTDIVAVNPISEVEVGVEGVIRELPESLIQDCPHTKSSPLDLLLGDYIHGQETTVFVRGSSAPNEHTPEWITQIISSVTVPVPFPGRTFDKLIRNFSLEDTNFSLPDPFAEPGSDEANPRISGNINVIASLPKEMNFGLNVTRVKATADVFYKGDKLGVLNLRKWQKAESSRIDPTDGEEAMLRIQSLIKNVPLNITDSDVFSDVIQELIFGGGDVILEIQALVDVEVSTVLGKLPVKQMPANGVVPVKPISTGDGFRNLNPKVGDLRVLSTDKTSLNFEARVNFTNPSNYTAQIPFINIHVLNNGSVVGEATVRNVAVVKGNNTNVLVQATWGPAKFGAEKGRNIGREFISQYISGFNTSLTFQAHNESIPHQPRLGQALSKFGIEIPTPRLSSPGHGDDGKDGEDIDDKPHFIDAAIFHLFSSKAEFILISPLQHSTIFLQNINATAFYNHTEPVGRIEYDLPFKVPPGRSTTPRLPVEWSFDSVGYERIKEALGGKMKLDGRGTVEVKLEHWSESVWYIGSGIGASVKL